MNRRTILAAMAATPLGAAAGPIPPGNRIAFDVARNGSRIGSHVLTFAREGDVTRVDVAIDLAVRIVGIPVYRYTHRNTERWRGERLVTMASTTDRNGTPYRVRAEAKGASVEVDGTDGGRFSAPADIVTTSYWHPGFIQSRKLDTQGGKLLEVAITDRGEETIKAGGADIAARRWTIAGDLALDIWYDRGGLWSKLRFAGDDGSVIEYTKR
jgi:hypothetical protein